MKKITVLHFDKKGDNTFTETWTLKAALTGDYQKDKKALTVMVLRDAHVPHKDYATKSFVVTWGDSNGFLLENK